MKYSIKSLIVSAACLAAMVTGPSFATANIGNNWYGGLSGDVTWLRHSDTGGGGNVSLGYRFNDFRLEAEAGYHGADGEDGYAGTHYFTYMGNLYYDFNTAFPVSSSGVQLVPYIGGGFGTTLHHHDNDFAYQGMAGLTYVSSYMPRTDWSLGYRYLGTDQDNLHSNNVELGLRYHF